MSVTVNQVATPVQGANVTSQQISFSSTPTAGRSAIVTYSGYNSSDRTGQLTCTDNQGNTYTLTKFSQQTNGSRYQVSATFHAHNIASSGTFTATVGGLAGSYCNVGMIEASGLNPAGTPITASNGASGSTNPATCTSGTTSSTSVADAIAIAVLDYDSDNGASTNIATPSGYTSIYLSNGGQECGSAAYKVLSATGAQSASWGTTINPGGEPGVWAAQIVVLEAAGGGGADTPNSKRSGAIPFARGDSGLFVPQRF